MNPDLELLKLTTELTRLQEAIPRLTEVTLDRAELNILAAYLRHCRDKKTCEIRLCNLVRKKIECRLELDRSRTAAGQHEWELAESEKQQMEELKRRLQLPRARNSGLGGAIRSPELALPPDGAEQLALRQAAVVDREHNYVRLELESLRSKDPDFETLIAPIVASPRVARFVAEALCNAPQKSDALTSGQAIQQQNESSGMSPQPLTPTIGGRQPVAAPENGIAESSMQPEQRLRKRARKMDLSNYLDAAGLTERQYQCASLHWEYGVSKARIARELGIDRSTVQEHINFAHSKFKSSKAGENLRRKLAKLTPGD